MTFLSSFLRSLIRRPRLAMTALYWYVTGKKVRARNRLRMGAANSPHAYQEWIASVERRGNAVAQMRTVMANWSSRPRISVLTYQAPCERADAFERRLATLSEQIYPDWELILAQSNEAPQINMPDVPRLSLVTGRIDNPLQALTQAIQAATGEYILPLAPDALLAPQALYRLAEALQAHPDATLLYGDEDRITAQSHRHAPWFKPAWNPELALAQDYLSGACLIERAAALRIGSADPALADPTLAEAGAYALALGVAGEDETKVHHVPHVLSHHSAPPAPNSQTTCTAVVAHHVAPLGAAARTGPHGTVAVDWPLPADPPLVSVIIPTRDHVGLLRTCVTGVLNATSYRAVEILIIDNGSRKHETLDYLSRVSGNPRVRVIRDDAPFNYSALNNRAAAEARGAYLCLLNNDVEILGKGWLTALMRQALRSHVGAVGAKLLYDDGTIQHAGVTIGLGDAAGHAHRFQANADAGYFARAHAAHYVSAVTGACLLVEKRKFDAVGGLDAAGFAVAYNDVDLCLKLQAAGWRNVYEPKATLIHHESTSRDKDFQPGQIERYTRELALLQDRWGTDGYADPLHHPHLDRNSETYRLYL